MQIQHTTIAILTWRADDFPSKQYVNWVQKTPIECHRTFVQKYYFIYDYVKDFISLGQWTNHVSLCMLKVVNERGKKCGLGRGARSLSRCDRIRRSEEACFQWKAGFLFVLRRAESTDLEHPPKELMLISHKTGTQKKELYERCIAR
jgi:hypothetical protein